MHNIKTNFDKILIVIKDIPGNYKRRGALSQFPDMAVMVLSLTAGCLSIDSENHLFSKLNAAYRGGFKNMLSRRQYNDRRKLLFEKMERG